MTIQELIETTLFAAETFLDSRGPLPLGRVASMCSISESCAQVILTPLWERKWLDTISKDDGKETAPVFHGGMGLLSFANEDRLKVELLRQSLSLINELADLSGQTAILSVLHEDRAFCLYRAESGNSVKLISRVGEEIPLHGGASGKVLLAYAAQMVRKRILSGPFRAFTPNTIVDEVELRREMEEIRENGFARSVEEVNAGACAIGVPILSRKGNLLAGLSIAGPRFDFQDNFEEYLTLVLSTVGQISRLM